jgi:hypothetical protein
VKTISDLENSVGELANGARDDLGFGPINRELSRVDSALDQSDAAPSAMVRESINKLCQDLSRRQSEWREFNSTAIPQANSALQKANAQPLPVANVAPAQACR